MLNHLKSLWVTRPARHLHTLSMNRFYQKIFLCSTLFQPWYLKEESRVMTTLVLCSSILYVAPDCRTVPIPSPRTGTGPTGAYYQVSGKGTMDLLNCTGNGVRRAGTPFTCQFVKFRPTWVGNESCFSKYAVSRTSSSYTFWWHAIWGLPL